jgi:hypothetical protein
MGVRGNQHRRFLPNANDFLLSPPPPNNTFCVEPAGGEEWKAEIHIRLAENIYVDLPLPLGWHGLKGKREFHNLKFKYIFGKLQKV